MFIFLIKISIIFISITHLLGLLLVWQYENKKAKMYRIVSRQIELLRHFGLSMAVLHAKIFKVEQDYLQWIEMIEGRQQFIFEKVLFLKRGSLKTKYKNSKCLQV